MSKSERIALVATSVVSIVLRAIAFFRYRFDSDEPQHLHVAWAWTAGLVQYRDVFDNHAPLFHLSMAPILALFGERPDIMLYMRAPMLVFWAIVLACTFVVGRRLYSSRIGWWSMVLLSLFPAFFLKSLEFRNDNLWMAFWMLSVVVLAGKPVTPSRLFAAGLLLGAAACTSLKAIVLVVTLLICAVVTRLFCGGNSPTARFIASIVAAFVGLAIVPAIIVAVIIRLGAWQSLTYCLFKFNNSVVLMRPNVEVMRAIYPIALACILLVAYGTSRRRERAALERWRFFLALFCAVFVANVVCFWVFVSPRDFLPVMPIAAVIATAAIERWSVPGLTAVPRFVVVACALVGFLTYYADRFSNGTAWHITMMHQALGLSRPGEPLLDYKGETVYRRRPYFPILEQITREQIERGWIRDTIEHDVLAANCHVAQADGPFWPPLGRRFLAENFLDMGRLRASGQWLAHDGGFTIAVPGEYVVLEFDGEPHGELDGTPYRGARFLEAGHHRFIHQSGPPRLACVWAPAWKRGYSPFDLKDRDF